MRLAIGNLKGGVGKTTTAMYIAHGLARAHPDQRVLVVDAAPTQQSAYRWSELAAELPLVVIPWSGADLAKRVKSVAGDYDHIVIDTPGQRDDLLRQAVMVVDELIVPLGPTPMEVSDLAQTFAIAGEVEALNEVDIRVLITRARTNTVSLRETLALLEERDIPRFQTVIHAREAYAGAFGSIPDQLGEYAALLDELTTAVVA